MEKFFIIANCEKDEGLKISRKAEAYLKSKGKMCTIGAEKSCERDADNHYTDASAIPEGVECVIVLGGDGTLLHAARDVVDRQIPLLGINLGTLGYLAEIDHSNIESALNHLMLDEYTIEKRMMLSGRVFHQGELMARDVTLNDIVIISTATGSTGYSLSAGGPIVSPETNILIMTPVAPHTLNTRSVIFPADDEITVEIGEGRQKGMARAVASFDGDTNVTMTTGDRIVIRRSVRDTQIVKISNISFLEVLRRKMKN